MATASFPLPIPPNGVDGTAPPGFTWANGRPYLLFDAGTDEICYWTFRLPQNYASAATLKIQWASDTATSGDVIWACQVMAVTPGDAADIATDSYDTANTVTDASGGTAGHPQEASMSLTNFDSATQGDYLALKFSRDADNASDTMTGDAELWAVTLEYTTT